MSSLKLSPTEFTYLKRPFWSEGEDMMKCTLQELCMKKSLAIEERWVYVDKRDSKKRKRYYLKPGELFASNKHNRGETFFLNAFRKRPELSLANVRMYIKFHFKKNTMLFKSKYVYPDMREKNLFNFLQLPTAPARAARKELQEKLDHIDTNIDALIANDSIAQELEQLSENIVLLKKATLKKITAINKEVLNINLTGLNLSTLSLSFPMLASFEGISSFDFASDGGFDGFGGGDFGGAGAGDSW